MSAYGGATCFTKDRWDFEEPRPSKGVVPNPPGGILPKQAGRLSGTRRPCLPHPDCLEYGLPRLAQQEASMKGLRFERLGNGHYYKIVLHIGSTYLPVTDEIVEGPKAKSLLPA